MTGRQLEVADLGELRCDVCGAGGLKTLTEEKPPGVHCAVCGRELGQLKTAPDYGRRREPQ